MPKIEEETQLLNNNENNDVDNDDNDDNPLERFEKEIQREKYVKKIY